MENMTNNLHEIHVWKQYNALYCNSAYIEAVNALATGEGANKSPLMVHNYGNYLVDAALECCGSQHYRYAVTVAMAIARQRGDAAVLAVAKFLSRFATLAHIEALELGLAGAK